MGNKSLSKNAFFNICYRLLNVVFPLISYAYVARVLLSDVAGITSAVQTNVSYFIILASLGIPAYGLREVAKVKNDENSKNLIVSELLIINSILTLFSILCFLVCVFFIPYFNKYNNLYLIYGFSIFLNFFSIDWLYQGMEEYLYISVRSTLVKVASLILTILFVNSPEDVYIFAFISVFALGGNNIFNIIHSRKYFRFSFKGINLQKHFKPLLLLALCSITTELYARMDISMLDYFANNSDVGYYSYAHRIVLIIITALVAVTAVFLPRLSKLFDDNPELFNLILRKGTNFVFLISVPACVGVFLLSKPIVLVLLGEDFYGSINCLRVLSLMIPIKCIGDLICYQVMLSARKESILMKSYLITMIANFISNWFLIPRMGAVGAAIASVFSEILAFMFVFLFSRKFFSNVISLITILKIVIAAAIMGTILYFVDFIKITYFVLLPFSIVLGLSVYFAMCYILKIESFINIVKLIKNKIRIFMKK